MSNWNTSNYRERKAQRRAKIEPQWITNPETGESFFVRRVGAVAYAAAGQLPYSLTAEAVPKWKEAGVEVAGGDVTEQKKLAESQKSVQLMARIVVEACVTPKIVQVPANDDELALEELDDSDLVYIFKWATGQVGPVALAGGNAGDVATFPKRPGRRSRTGTDS